MKFRIDFLRRSSRPKHEQWCIDVWIGPKSKNVTKFVGQLVSSDPAPNGFRYWMFCASLHRKHEKRQDFFLEIHFDSVTDAKKWVRKNSDRLYYLAIGTFE